MLLHSGQVKRLLAKKVATLARRAFGLGAKIRTGRGRRPVGDISRQFSVSVSIDVSAVDRIPLHRLERQRDQSRARLALRLRPL